MNQTSRREEAPIEVKHDVKKAVANEEDEEAEVVNQGKKNNKKNKKNNKKKGF